MGPRMYGGGGPATGRGRGPAIRALVQPSGRMLRQSATQESKRLAKPRHQESGIVPHSMLDTDNHRRVPILSFRRGQLSIAVGPPLARCHRASAQLEQFVGTWERKSPTTDKVNLTVNIVQAGGTSAAP